jgi:serine/threonine-protein kinase
MADMPEVQPDSTFVGRTLGAYRVLESLGSGGMGHVYLAEDPRLGRRVALKVLSRETAAQSEKIARFEREARAVAQLSHPGIVMLHSIEEADGLRFLTMEYVEGETLSKAIPRAASRPSASCRSRSGSPTPWPRRTARASCTATSSPRT